jgi:hypothetical protein
MTLTQQPTLGLRVDQRTALVTAETARISFGCDAETLQEMVDDGRLRWVWDIGLHGYDARRLATRASRELRFWLTELRDPPLTAALTAAQVIDQVIGTQRDRLRAVELERHVLVCSASLIWQLLRAGEFAGPLVGHSQFIWRVSLANFLHSRLQK